MFPKRFFMERDTPVRKPLVYLFMYVCQISPKQSPPTWRETWGHRPQSPTKTKAYIQLGAVWFPNGTVVFCYCYRAVYSSPLMQDFASVAFVSVTNTCVRDTVSAGRRKLWNWIWGRKLGSIMYKVTDTNQTHSDFSTFASAMCVYRLWYTPCNAHAPIILSVTCLSI